IIEPAKGLSLFVQVHKTCTVGCEVKRPDVKTAVVFQLLPGSLYPIAHLRQIFTGEAVFVRDFVTLPGKRVYHLVLLVEKRSEERRVGKECRSRRSPDR